MNEFEKLNLVLISEANTILYDYGLLEILEKYGNSIIHGSYALNLMTWRDLDIYLETDEITVKTFFNLGVDIATKLKPHRIHYRNELIGETPNLPKGLYWGIYTKVAFLELWKIDIWAMDSKQLTHYREKFQALKSKITKNKRLAILKIKSNFCNHPEYRKKFNSLDIYTSILQDNISTEKEFETWLKENKGI